MTETVAENYARIRERMEKACTLAGRRTEEIALEAVSKYVPAERLQQAVDLGLTLFGENHAQELVEKQTFFELHGAQVHFIGQLQTNKIKYVCGKVDMVESLDRPHLAEALQRRAESLGVTQDVLLQVNIGDESQKGGVSGEDLDLFAQNVMGLTHLRVRGLMCVPPALSPEETRPYFARMYKLYAALRDRYPEQRIDTLSMGMSHDYEAAILEGATVVRVGTALFGARDRK